MVGWSWASKVLLFLLCFAVLSNDFFKHEDVMCGYVEDVFLQMFMKERESFSELDLSQSVLCPLSFRF